ncbi:MAG TPA: hypothetical protein VD908_21260 [Cytophagales bacterium]|nr:hypothetical protein [Cytophagales bacterium]
MENKNKNPDKDLKNENENNNLTSQEALNKVNTNPIQADDVDGIVTERTTGSNPVDRAGISDLDRGMARGSRRNS